MIGDVHAKRPPRHGRPLQNHPGKDETDSQDTTGRPVVTGAAVRIVRHSDDIALDLIERAGERLALGVAHAILAMIGGAR